MPSLHPNTPSPQHSFSIATWNVNSIRSRLSHLTGWLCADKPDIVLLQELKCINENFPAMEIEDLGYNIAMHGEKTYNGVAILSKFPLEDVRRGLPGNEDDPHARYIEAVVNVPSSLRGSETTEAIQSNQKWIASPSARNDGTIGAIRVASVYVPNGQTADSDKFQYKLRFLNRLRAHLQTLLGYEEMLVIGGDYNIAPTDDDVHNPKAWEGSVLTHDDVRAAWRRIEYLGYYNALKLIPNHESRTTNHYSWWDYRAGAFERDDGLLIDHLLLSPEATDRFQNCVVKKDLRALEKPSDHTPVIATFTA